MKINNKYSYYHECLKSKKSVNKNLHNFYDNLKFFINLGGFNIKDFNEKEKGVVQDFKRIAEENKMFTTKRRENIQLKVDSIVKIYRWDFNGSFSEEKVLSISKYNDNTLLVITENGKFYFDGKTNYQFQWEENKENEWVSSWQTNIIAEDYYYNDK
jgi:hypothetical protein